MIRILLFENNTQLAEGISFLINSVDNLRVVGCFKNLNSLEHEIKNHEPHVVLMDVEFPLGNGIEGLRGVKRLNNKIKVIMLSGMTSHEHLLESIKCGADGYILKKTAPAKFLEYIQEAYEGGAPMSPSIARQIIETFSANNNTTPVTDENLTLREKDVLRSLVRGMSYKLVGFELNIAIDTVRSHIKNIYEKLEVNSKSEAVAKAIRHNIV
jgi:DNA-binding NarL/FixJ family response regulator